MKTSANVAASEYSSGLFSVKPPMKGRPLRFTTNTDTCDDKSLNLHGQVGCDTASGTIGKYCSLEYTTTRVSRSCSLLTLQQLYTCFVLSVLPMAVSTCKLLLY
eukprot:16184-Heterococcus_DN1.PRE.5